MADPQLIMERNILFDQIEPLERALDTASKNDEKCHQHLTVILRELKALKAEVDGGNDYLQSLTGADKAKKVAGTLQKPADLDPDHPNGGHGGILPEGTPIPPEGTPVETKPNKASR